MPKLARLRTVVLATAALAGAAIVACSSANTGSTFGNKGGGGSGGGAAGSGGEAGGEPGGSGGVGGGIGGGIGLDASGGGSNSDASGPLGDAACATSSQVANHKPLDLFIMLDQSGSMDGTVDPLNPFNFQTKWNAVLTALGTFVTTVPDPLTVSVGMQFFALPAGLDESCNAADYATAAVPIAPLDQAQIDRLIQVANQHSPSTNTPTAPALDGAIRYAKQWALQNPTHTTVVVFATDGEPSECDPQDVATIAQTIAAPGFNDPPSMPTYVVGVGDLLANLNMIAAAGGTQQAYIVNSSAQQFVDAMNDIRGTTVGCKYSLPVPPDGGALDPTHVNVFFTPNGGSPAVVVGVADANACDPSTGGWYYDQPPPNETTIVLCPATCDAAQADANAKVDVELGCDTVTHIN